MSVIATTLRNMRPETAAEALRLEMAQRADRAYERAVRLRKVAVLVSLAFSMVQCAWSIAVPPGPQTDGLSPTSVVWGIPLLASFFTVSLMWSCRMSRDQCLDQYVDYLRKIGVLAEDLSGGAEPTA